MPSQPDNPLLAAFPFDRWRAIGEKASRLLAILTLTGDSGIDARQVVSLLGLASDDEATGLLQELEAAGIPIETDTTRIAILAPKFRVQVASQIFFSEKGFDYRKVAEPLEGLEPLQTLLEVALSGAPVPRGLLVEELESRTGHLHGDILLGSPFYPGTSLVSVFRTFARLGPRESKLALERYREHRIADIADALLVHLPEATLERLLGQTSTEGNAPLGLQSLVVIQRWLEAMNDPRPPLERRETLLNVLERRSLPGLWQHLESQVCLAAISPILKAGHSATTLLESRTESEFRKLVQRTFSLLLRSTSDLPWSEIHEALARFQWPEPRTEEAQRVGRKLLGAALEHLAERAKESLPERFSWLQAAEEFAFEGPLVLEVRAGYEEELTEAEILFSRSENQEARVPPGWLERWALADPAPILARWRTLFPCARKLGLLRHENVDRIVGLVAELTPAPLIWIQGLVEMAIHETALSPFLTRLDEADFGRVAPELLDLENYRWSVALEIAIRNAPPDLLPLALLNLENNLPRLREEVRFNAELATAMAKRNLHGESKVAWILATAVLALPRFEDLELKRVARRILLTRPILPGLSIAIWAGLCNDLARDPELAADWLIALSLLPQPPRSAGVPEWFSSERELSHLIGARLPLSAKIRILREAAPAFLGRFAPELVGQNPELYQLLIAAGVSPEAIELPLEGMRPGPDWIPFAEAAQDAGLAATNIARQAILHGMWGGSPTEIQKWMAALREIENERPQLAEVAREGLKMAETRLAEALEIQKRIEMRGLVAGG